MSRIYVTGIGIITAIGNNASENRDALIRGVCGIGNAKFLRSKYTALMPFAEVKTATPVLQQQLNAFEKGVTRTSLLALHAFEENARNTRAFF